MVYGMEMGAPSRRFFRRAAALALLSVWLAGCGDSPAPARSGRGEVEVTADGAWCWFADPRAIHHRGKHSRTYAGWVTAGGAVRVGYYDHATRAVAAATLRERLQGDDHASPALVVLPDGRLMVFYSAHGGKSMFYRVARESEDISAWWSEREVETNTRGRRGYTYPNPLLLRGEEDRIYLFWRGGDYKPAFSFTADGVRWQRARTLVRGRGQRPYVKYVSDGDTTIHFAFTDGHPRNEPANSIYYAYYRAGGLHRADGLLIKGLDGLPLKPEEAEMVYDGNGSGARAWIWDIALDMAGRPAIVYAVMPTETDHRYRYARWTGTAWEDREIAGAGKWFPSTAEGEREPEPHYSGGVVLDHADPSVVYLSRGTQGTFEIERWVTPDGGRTWASARVTSGSGVVNVRPVVARGSLRDDAAVLWMSGRYAHYTKYETGIRMILVPREAE